MMGRYRFPSDNGPARLRLALVALALALAGAVIVIDNTGRELTP